MTSDKILCALSITMSLFLLIIKALDRRPAIAVFGAVLVLIAGPAYSRGQETPPPDPVAIFNEAQDLHEKGDLLGAVALYQKALRLLPQFPEAEYQQGVAYLALGRAAEGESAFRRAVALRPDWTLANVSLGSLLIQDGSKAKLEAAEKILEKILDAEPQNPPALAAMVDLRLKAHASQEVLASLLRQITPMTSKAKPTPSIWMARAGLEAALGDRKAARTSLDNALIISPNNRAALLQLGQVSVADGDVVRAKDILAKLEKLGAAADDLALLRANIFAAEGDLDGALKHLDSIKNQSVAVDTRDRINAARSTGAADLEKRLVADPVNAIALGRLCSLYRRDDPAKALDYCRRAAAVEPGNIDHSVGFGAALVQARRFAEAAAVLNRVVAAAPENSSAHANLATALFQLKRYPEAKEQFSWLTRTQPQSAGAYFFLGIIHDHMSEYIDAIANYQQYLRLADPAANRLDIEKVNLRMPALQKFVKDQKGKSSSRS